MSEPPALQVFCTIDTEAGARDLATALVRDRHAACVQVLGPIHSVYRWDDAVQEAPEWLLLVKSSPERFDALSQAIVAVHPYDTPEIVAVPIEAGHPPYLSWIADSIS